MELHNSTSRVGRQLSDYAVEFDLISKFKMETDKCFEIYVLNISDRLILMHILDTLIPCILLWQQHPGSAT